MIGVLSWLKDFTPIETDIKTFCEDMTDSGSKVETYTVEGADLSGIVTGKILSISKHENSDHLLICQVNVGQAEALQIVTGAPNVVAGQTVPVALDGASLAGGVKIKRGKLRGEVSEGMLCSVQELGYTTEDFPEAAADGIFILPDSLRPGMSIQDALHLDETQIEFEITSNRPDCFSMEGLGREAAITYRQAFEPVNPQVVAKNPQHSSEFIKLRNLAPELCFAYRGRVVTDVQVAPSPQWMQKRLRAAGMRPIDNIVDITNYVMLELGQPLHAFDLENIGGAEIVVRRAEAGEVIRTLDEQDRKLSTDMLVICDAEKPMAVAGIMGGINSGISESTRTIVFESATFKADSVRVTAQSLGLRTESSTRFEKGLDVASTERALNRACELVEQLSCGKVCQGAVEALGEQPAERLIAWDSDRINHFLGTSIEALEMVDILERVGCVRIEQHTDNARIYGVLQMPGYRPDLEVEADLSEEIARFHGYNKIPATLLSGKSFTRGGLSYEQKLREKIMEISLGQGFYQSYSYTFESPKLDDLLDLPADSPLRNHVQIKNAAEDYSVMRSSMLPSMLKIAAQNAKRAVSELKIFEIGTVFGALGEDSPLPDERQKLAALAYDLDEDKNSGASFFTLKALVNEIALHFGIKGLRWVNESPLPALNPYRSGAIYLNEHCIGYAAYLLPRIVKRFGAPESTAYLELDLRDLFTAAQLKRSQRALPKFPAVKRDIAFTLDKALAAADIEAGIMQAGMPNLRKAELFDIYQGKQVEAGKKSMAYRLSFRSQEKTLTDTEVNESMQKIVQALAEKYKADIRG